MDIEIHPTKRYVFDSHTHISTKFTPVGYKAPRGKWVTEPGNISIRHGNFNTVTEYDDYYPYHKHLLDAISEKVRLSPNLDVPVPSCYAQAKNSPQWPLWREACNAELAALDDVDTYSFVPRSDSIEVDGVCEWEFSIEDNGTYRAKIVARGTSMYDGVSYFITARPVQTHNLFRMFFAAAAKHCLPVTHMKFNSAYFNADTTENLYVTTPPGLFSSGNNMEGHLFKLKKLLNGFIRTPLGQAQQMAKALRTQGFFQVSTGVPIFHRGANQNFVLIGVFDENLLIATGNEAKLENVKSKLTAQFKMRDFRTPRKINGINIEFSNVTKLHLGDYIDSLLRDYNMENCTPQKIPAGNVDLNIDTTKAEKSCDFEKYRSLVGKLAYAAGTVRFDIDHIVRELLRYLETPKQKHWEAAKNVVRYLKGTKFEGLTYGSAEIGATVEAYASSKCGEIKRDLYLAYLIKYSGSPIFWRTRFGDAFVESSHSKAIKNVIGQALWTLDTLKDIGLRTNCLVYSDDRNAVLDQRSLLPQYRASYYAKGTKRARANDQSNGSYKPDMSIYQMSDNPITILTACLPYNSHKLYHNILRR